MPIQLLSILTEFRIALKRSLQTTRSSLRWTNSQLHLRSRSTQSKGIGDEAMLRIVMTAWSLTGVHTWMAQHQKSSSHRGTPLRSIRRVSQRSDGYFARATEQLKTPPGCRTPG